MLEIIAYTGKGRVDLSRLFSSLKWSGDKNAAARSLNISILPEAEVELGDRVAFSSDGEVLLDGFISSISEKTGLGSLKDVEVHDRGLQLNRNQGVYKFQNATPAEIVRTVCGDFGVEIGELPDTGDFRLTRNFVGVSLYKIIATAYSKAMAETGVHYHIRFVGRQLTVKALARRPTTPLLTPGSNLISASASRSIEKLVNRVVIVDKDGNVLTSRDDTGSQTSYGLSQSVMKDSDNAQKEAAQLLREQATPEYKISVEGLGDTRFTSGETVAVQDRATGLWGVFAIDGDSHVWEGGTYKCSLTLTMQNVMEEVDAGTDVK